jgi:hypothetical protein
MAFSGGAVSTNLRQEIVITTSVKGKNKFRVKKENIIIVI